MAGLCVLPWGHAGDRLEVPVEMRLVVEAAFGGHVSGPVPEAQKPLGREHAERSSVA